MNDDTWTLNELHKYKLRVDELHEKMNIIEQETKELIKDLILANLKFENCSKIMSELLVECENEKTEFSEKIALQIKKAFQIPKEKESQHSG